MGTKTPNDKTKPQEVSDLLSKEAGRIRSMFGSIAPRYDLLNHLLSLNTDVIWRRQTARRALKPADRRVLDLACGTGDLAFELSRRAHPGCLIAGADFTRPMLVRAGEKNLHHPRKIEWIEADGLRLPFQDQSFDLITIAFGIRNMASLDTALAEMHRVLKPGGRLAVLEFTQPENPVIRAVYMPYFLHVLPRVAALLSQKKAYLYLPFSVLQFPSRRELAHLMHHAGFGRVRHRLLTFGVAALHLAEKDE